MDRPVGLYSAALCRLARQMEAYVYAPVYCSTRRSLELYGYVQCAELLWDSTWRAKNTGSARTVLFAWILANLEQMKNQKWGLWKSRDAEREIRAKQADSSNYGMVLNSFQHLR